MPILSEEQSRLELYSPAQFFHHSFKLDELVLLPFFRLINLELINTVGNSVNYMKENLHLFSREN